MENKYHWKLKSFARGIDPDLAVKELALIEEKHGALTASAVLESATSKKSILHPLFLWDDTEAALRYRLRQANDIINNISVLTITDGEERQISVYEIVHGDNGNVFKHIESFTAKDIEQIKMRTIRDLNTMRSKLSIYQDFETVIEQIGEVIGSLSEMK